MQKAGGIIALIAGIFGIFAAVVTLFMGGAVSTFGSSEGGNTVILLGFGGLFFSFLEIVFGAIAMGATTKKPGIAIIISAILGIWLGGTFVACVMVLALVGGILCLVGVKQAAVATPVITGKLRNSSSAGSTFNEEMPSQPKKTISKTRKILNYVGIIFFGFIGVLVLIDIFAGKNTSTQNQNSSTEATSAQITDSDDPIANLTKATPAAINSADLATTFSFGSNSTDLQREDQFASIKGKVVDWTLPVFEVSRSGDGYKVQTSGSDGNVGVFIYLSSQNDADTQAIKQMKTGDQIHFKGIISDTMMRNIVIKPAILVQGANQASAPSAQNNGDMQKSETAVSASEARYVGATSAKVYKNNREFNTMMFNLKEGGVIKLNLKFDSQQNESLKSSPKNMGDPLVFVFDVDEGKNTSEEGGNEYLIHLPSDGYNFGYQYDKATLEGCFIVGETAGPQMMIMSVNLTPVQCQ